MLGLLICTQIISQIGRLAESIKEELDIGFGSAGDDHFQPRNTRGRAGQKPEDGWATTIVATFVECVNDKDKEVTWAVREVLEKVKEN